MKIQLTSTEVLDLVKQYIAGFGMDLSNRQVDIQMTEAGDVDILIDSADSAEHAEDTGADKPRRKRRTKAEMLADAQVQESAQEAPQEDALEFQEAQEPSDTTEPAEAPQTLPAADTPISIFG